METNETSNNEKQEKGANMEGFSLSEDLGKKAAELARSMTGKAGEQAVAIPDSGGQVLVKAETPACDERAEDTSIIMIPLMLEEGMFFVCSK